MLAIKIGSRPPSLNGATEWLNTENAHNPNNQTATEATVNLSGGLVLVHFWAMSCPSCHANMPHLQQLRDKYGPQGLQTIAVHMPRGEFDLDAEKIKHTAAELGVTEPCAIDDEHAIGDLFGVTAWPTYFLFGADGKLRRQAKGNFGVRMMEQALIRLFEGDA